LEFRLGLLKGKECPLCNEKAAEEAEREERRVGRLMAACGGARAYRLYTRGALKVGPGNRAAVAAVEAFHPDSDNLLLWGPCGTGKSHLASILGREFVGSVIFTEPAPLLRSLRGLTPAQEQARIDELVTVPVLILDDLGIEKDTEFAISTISEIVSHRLKADRNGLVVTSNLSLEALAAKLKDDRLTSRLAGMCQVIEISGEDYRLKGKA
jgi:DNA replication protein DnaC